MDPTGHSRQEEGVAAAIHLSISSSSSNTCSHPQLISRSPAPASPSFPAPSRVIHTHLPLLTSFPQLIALSQLPLQQVLLVHAQVTYARSVIG